MKMDVKKGLNVVPVHYLHREAGVTELFAAFLWKNFN